MIGGDGIVTDLHLHAFANDLPPCAVEVATQAPDKIGNDAGMPTPGAHHRNCFTLVELVPLVLFGFPSETRVKGSAGDNKSMGIDSSVFQPCYPSPSSRHSWRRAVTSISIRIRGSIRPAMITIAAGRTSPNQRRSTGQQSRKSLPGAST